MYQLFHDVEGIENQNYNYNQQKPFFEDRIKIIIITNKNLFVRTVQAPVIKKSN